MITRLRRVYVYRKMLVGGRIWVHGGAHYPARQQRAAPTEAQGEKKSAP